MPTMSITFHGLCLFARSFDKQRLHVFLGQPPGCDHSTILRRRESDGSWTATEVQRWTTFQHGRDGTVQMPTFDQMSDFSTLPGCLTLPEKDAHAAVSKPPAFTPHDSRGSHLVLRGGALTAGECAVWRVVDYARPEYHFPHVARWTGWSSVDEELEIWNALADEVPTLGKPSQPPNPHYDDKEAARRAKMHFEAYYRILTGCERPDCQPPDLALVRSRGTLVSSCPSAQATLV